MSIEDYILATFSNIFQILVIWRILRLFFFPREEKRKEMAGFIGYLVFSLAVFFGFQSPLCNMVTSWSGLVLLTVVIYEGTWKKKALISTLVWTVNLMCDAVASYLFYDYMGGICFRNIWGFLPHCFCLSVKLWWKSLWEIGERET